MIRDKEIAKILANEIGVSQIDARNIMNIIFGAIKQELSQWWSVLIREFATFSVKEAMGRTVVVPSTKVTSLAKVYKKVACSFSIKFRTLIKKS